MNTNDNYQREFEQFLNSYRVNKNKPLKTLFYLYRGNMKRLFISSLFFLVKHSPVWIIPVVTANIINIASQPSKHSISELWINLGIAGLVIIQNIPTHMLHVKFFSRAIRYVEAGLRGTLVRIPSSGSRMVNYPGDNGNGSPLPGRLSGNPGLLSSMKLHRR